MKRWFKTYFLTVSIIYIVGTIREYILGYRYFCDGWKSCDKYGSIIDIDTVASREISILLFTLASSIIITFFVLRAIDMTRKEREKDHKV